MDISYRAWKVFWRDFIVFRKTWLTNIMFNFLEPLLYLAAMGSMKSRITPPYGELYLQSKFALCFGVLFNGHANLDQSVDVDRAMLDHQIIPAAAITFVALTVATCDRNYR